jgi:parallel beta-helix repeat protein
VRAPGTVIQAPATLPAAGDIVQIDGSSVNVDMSALTVAGPGPSTCGSINAGIHVMNSASANLHGLTVKDIRDQPLSGCQNGRAIRVGDPGSPATATVSTSSILNYQKNGLDVRDPASTLDAHDNTITGPGATPVIASNGVVVVGGPVATIVHNTISGNECNDAAAVPPCGPDPVNDTQSCGILLDPAGAGSTVSGNTVSTNDIGIYNIADGTTTISGNTLTNNRFEGIVLDSGDATVTLNTIQGGNIGLAALSFGGNPDNSTGTLTCNNIAGATVAGIKVIDDNTSDAVTPGVGGSTNSIMGNAADFVNTTADTQTFIGNWWGCVAGPNNPGCDTISGPVTVFPVATSVPGCVPNSAPVNLTQAKFKKNTSGSGANGSITLKGDFLISGPPLTTSNPIGIQVSDNLGTTQSFVWTTCVSKGTKITCKSPDAQHSSQAAFKQIGVPNQWRFTIKLKRRSITPPSRVR